MSFFAKKNGLISSFAGRSIEVDYEGQGMKEARGI